VPCTQQQHTAQCLLRRDSLERVRGLTSLRLSLTLTPVDAHEMRRERRLLLGDRKRVNAPRNAGFEVRACVRSLRRPMAATAVHRAGDAP